MSSALLIPSATSQFGYDEVSFTETVRGQEVNFRLLRSVDFVPHINHVTSAAVVPFIKQGKIVATVLERGLDIPGGHVETSDNGLVGTIKREAREEACISLADPLYLIGVISSDYEGKDPEQTTYMLITAARVESMDDFVPNFESIGKEIVTTSEFLNRYCAGSQEMMKEIIKRADGLCTELFPN